MIEEVALEQEKEIFLGKGSRPSVLPTWSKFAIDCSPEMFVHGMNVFTA